jgi:dipeptidyl aminopeptidase/acylaminoacyl peptidase
MKHDDSGMHEILPNQFSAHAGVNELGGGSFAVDSEGGIIFVDEETQDVYGIPSECDGTTLILKAEEKTRYADFFAHPHQHQWIVAAKEDHTHATPETQAYGVRNSLVAIHRDLGTCHTIVEGDDFFSSPRFSHDGSHLCWIQWSHPDMPWTGTELFVAKWTDGSVTNIRKVAGHRRNQSVSQPRWTPNDRLLFADDRSGFWQLYCYSLDDSSTEAIVIIGLEKSEFAIADWRLGRYGFVCFCLSSGEG